MSPERAKIMVVDDSGIHLDTTKMALSFLTTVTSPAAQAVGTATSSSTAGAATGLISQGCGMIELSRIQAKTSTHATARNDSGIRLNRSSP